MRLILCFDLSTNLITYEYRKMFISCMKKSLSEYEEGKFYDVFFGELANKDYCFGVKLNNPKYQKEKISISDKKMIVEFSCLDDQLGLILMNSFLGQKNKKFCISKNETAEINFVKLKRMKPIHSKSVIFKIMSPLCVRKHDADTNKDYYLSCESDEFLEIFKKNLKFKVPESLKESVDNLSIVPINNKKTVIRHNRLFIECTLGNLAMHGDIALLEWIYAVGGTSRNAAGFGLLEVGNI